MAEIIEIASYPKSGNSWVIRLFSHMYGIPLGNIPGIHQNRDRVHELMADVELDKKYRFYKSHLTDNPLVNPHRIVYIYRHPLDVLFSALNFFYIRKRENVFINGVCKPVDQIYADGEVGHYFERFNKNLGLNFFPVMLKKTSSYARHIDHAFRCKKCVYIRYEDLVDAPQQAFGKLLAELFPAHRSAIPADLFSEVDAVTKYSNNEFFWKAKKNTHREYLTAEQVGAFNRRHRKMLKRLGYLDG